MLFAGQHISKSPFEVDVEKAQGDASKVTAKGPGLEATGNIANKPTYFDIYTAGVYCSVLNYFPTWVSKQNYLRIVFIVMSTIQEFFSQKVLGSKKLNVVQRIPVIDHCVT